jgi:hypothetical protein
VLNVPIFTTTLLSEAVLSAVLLSSLLELSEHPAISPAVRIAAVATPTVLRMMFLKSISNSSYDFWQIAIFTSPMCFVGDLFLQALL